MRLRSALSKSALVLGAALAALIAAEIGLRLLWPDHQAQRLAQLADGKALILRRSAVPDLGYELTPNTAGRAWGTDVRVNAHGLRGPAVRADRAGRTRVAITGDSIAFGNDLPEADVLPYRLQAALDAIAPRFEILNLAVGGYDVVQEVARVEQLATALAPDIVVVAYCLNDAGVISINAEYLARVESARDSLWRHSWLLRFAASQLEQNRAAREFERANEPAAFGTRYADWITPLGAGETALRGLMAAVPDTAVIRWYRDADRVGRVRHAFGRLAELARRHEFAVAVLIIPWLVWPDGVYPYSAAHEIVAGEAGRAGFDVIDPVAAFTAQPARALRLAGNDPAHPNAQGHALLAQALERYLIGR